MITNDEITAIGKFLKTHALKGELNAVFDINADLNAIEAPRIIDVDGLNVPFFIDSVRPKGHFASLVKLNGVENEQDAKPFVNKTIYLLKSDLADLEDDDTEGEYADDMVGYQVLDTELGPIGEITDVDLSTQNTLFIITTPDGETVYIPVSEDFIDSIDPDGRQITMTLPDGLVDLNIKKENKDG